MVVVALWLLLLLSLRVVVVVGIVSGRLWTWLGDAYHQWCWGVVVMAFIVVVIAEWWCCQ